MRLIGECLLFGLAAATALALLLGFISWELSAPSQWDDSSRFMFVMAALAGAMLCFGAKTSP